MGSNRVQTWLNKVEQGPIGLKGFDQGGMGPNRAIRVEQGRNVQNLVKLSQIGKIIQNQSEHGQTGSKVAKPVRPISVIPNPLSDIV